MTLIDAHQDNRRRFLKTAAAGAGFGLMAACGKSGKSNEGVAASPADGAPELTKPPTPGPVSLVSEKLAAEIAALPEVTAFNPALAELAATADYETAMTFAIKDAPTELPAASIALIPLVSGDKETPRFLMVAFADDRSKVGAEIMEILPDGYRIWTTPAMDIGFQIFSDAAGFRGIIMLGLDDRYIKCVLTKVAIFAGMNPLALQICYSNCLAGGLANPICQACLAGGAVFIGVAWLAC